MNLALDHGFKENDRSKIDFLVTTDKFSIAVFFPSNKSTISFFSHSHDSYEFVIPLTTVPLLKCEKAFCVGEVGYCYPVEPGVLHGIEFDLNSAMISIVIDKKYMDYMKEKMGYENQHFFKKFLISYVYLTEIWTHYIGNDNKAFDKLVKYLITEGFKIDNTYVSREAKYFMNVRESIIFLMNNYTDPDLTIEMIAKHSSYSITYYTKVFKKYMNDTPVNNLNKLRLSKAKELMSDKSLSLEEISRRSGYKTNSCFTEAFKRIVGMTPFDYRKKYI